MRIVSLVPSTTETVLALHAPGVELVGRTRYCVEPAGRVAHVETVGGTKDVDVARVVSLAPDLVLANREENTRADVEALCGAGLRVDLSFPLTVADGIEHLAHVAQLLGADASAEIAAARRTLEALEERRRARPPLRTFCPIWMDPLMTIHGETYISDALDLLGCANVFADRPRRYPLAADLGCGAALPAARVGDRDTRYPRVSLAEVVARAPELVVLPDEPHPFGPDDARVFAALPIPAARDGRIVHVDGKDLMWFGARSAPGLARLGATLAPYSRPG